MRTVVIYESMFRNTHRIADAIGEGLRSRSEVVVFPVGEVRPDALADVDLLVVGGPTHGHSLSRPESRETAVKMAHEPDAEVELDPDAEGPGLREWFDALGELTGRAIAFDTRVGGPKVLTGRASKGITKRLQGHGLEVVGPPESFLVTMENNLHDGEEDRARAWGRQLADRVLTVTTRPPNHP